MVLAACCAGRVMGNRTRNLENALALYRATFAVWDRQNTPVDWALAQLNLARIYLAYAGVEPGLAAQSRSAPWTLWTHRCKSRPVRLTRGSTCSL